MKKLKNNKGVTGIDIVVSVTIIVIVLGIAMAVYSSYSKKTKEVERTSTATNLAMKVIETIEEIEIGLIPDTLTINNENKGTYGLDSTYNVTEYTITIKKIESTDPILQKVAFQIDVTVTYKVEDEIKRVTLSTIKKYQEIGEAQEPDMESSTIEGCIPVKYDAAKNGYVKSHKGDSEWYSISSKVFPVVVNIGSNNFDKNGIIKLEECSAIYVWMPSYGTYNDKYRFCDKNGHVIKYTVDSSTKIGTYETDSDVSVDNKVSGNWVEVNANLEAKTANTNYDNLKNNIFSW